MILESSFTLTLKGHTEMQKNNVSSPILRAVKRFVLDCSMKYTKTEEMIKDGKKIPMVTFKRMIDPKVNPTESTMLGFSAINFEEATGCSIYGFIIEQAKLGLWGKVDHLPEIKSHKDLLAAFSSLYKNDSEEQLVMLRKRAEFESRRDINLVLSGRPFYWRRIPGTLEMIAFYKKGIEPKGSPKSDTAFDHIVSVESVESEINMKSVGIGYAVKSVVSISDLIDVLSINQADVTQIQRLGIVRALVGIAEKFGITPASLKKNPEDFNPAAVQVLMDALGSRQTQRR